jgi:Tol biopolymer transport system component
MRSSVEIYDVATGSVRVVLQTDALIEAPNWHPSGDWLLVNGDGLLFRLPLAEPALHRIESGFAIKCNNDHGFTPDGTQIWLSHHDGRGSEIFVMPAAGGTPRPVTQQSPSWWHGCAPDGSRIAYPAARGDKRVIDIYSCAADGSDERRLTFGEGHCDGPDYAADGSLIYYNSDRPTGDAPGHAQIWVMAPDGTGHHRLFADDQVNWFPHPSPDGKHVLYLAYPPGTEGHPRDLQVALCLMAPDGTNRRRILEFTGGQGTINVPCWAPDGSAFAYMRYELPG